MSIADIFKKKKARGNSRYLYTKQELAEFEAYVEKSLGSYDHVFHEIVSSDIHLDIIIIPPTEEQPYYKLVTMGAGAYKMEIPKEFRKFNIAHAEYVIFLPEDWKIDSSQEADYWPVRHLKVLARLPVMTNTWFAYGHTLQANEGGNPFASNTKFIGSMLKEARDQAGEPMTLKLSSGKTIRFYQVIPLYSEEMDYKLKHDADELIEKLALLPGFPVVDLTRENVAKFKTE